MELAPLRNALVGLPGVSGLSVEQRKRLTIAVELVANPSIIFLDEPTSGTPANDAGSAGLRSWLSATLGLRLQSCAPRKAPRLTQRLLQLASLPLEEGWVHALCRKGLAGYNALCHSSVLACETPKEMLHPDTKLPDVQH